MDVFFAFVDEVGEYKQESRNDRFPYYLKACVLIPSKKWKVLSAKRHCLCEECGINTLHELKWNHLWQLYRRDIKGMTIKFEGQETFLNQIKHSDAENFIESMLTNLVTFDATIIITVTPNCVFKDKVAKEHIEKFHYQDLMQRVEMEMAPTDSLAVIISDQLSSSGTEISIRKSYSRFFKAGDFIKNYSHILDSISFQCSHHSCGIQLADFVAGAIHGFLRNYEFSQKVSRSSIFPRVRCDESGDPFGHGIIDVPKREKSREHLIGAFKNDFSVNGDIPF